MSRDESPTRVLVVAGARPNFMKVAPVLRALDARPGFEPLLVHTGQHYDEAMSDRFFAELGIRAPDIHLEVGSGSHAAMTGEVLKRIEGPLLDTRPEAVIVVGDVNSTLAATLAAVKLGIPVAHVEAGLRSYDRTMPEEINRVLTDAVARWLFLTERSARDNLLREGVDEARIHFVGNVMIDTLRAHMRNARSRPVLDELGLEPGAYGVLTLHRPANVDDPEMLERLFAALEEIHRDLPLVFPIHPRTAAAVAERRGGRDPALRVVPPLGYLDFLRLLMDARLVLTDSGGIQEETTVLGVPCLTLRDNTERPVTVSEGTNCLVGRDPDRIRTAARRVIAESPKGSVPELWDGGAAVRITDILERDLRAR